MDAVALVDLEIEALLRQLDQKKTEQANLNSRIESANSRIAAVSAKFDKQLSYIEDTQRRIEIVQRSLQEERTKLTTEMDKCRSNEDATASELAVARQEVEKQKTKESHVGELSSSLEDECALRRTWLSKVTGPIESLQHVQGELEACRKKKTQLKSNTEHAEGKLADYRAQVASAEGKLPTLDAEKKRAVTSRSFKEAGRLANEIKSVHELKETLEAEIGSCSQALNSATEALEACSKTEQALALKLSAQTTAVDLSEIAVLQLKVKSLKKQKRRRQALFEYLDQLKSMEEAYDKEEAVCVSAIELLRTKNDMPADGTNVPNVEEGASVVPSEAKTEVDASVAEGPETLVAEVAAGEVAAGEVAAGEVAAGEV
eukprot:Platyproteum_vivax@DN4765_c0_g1_i1.p1